MTVMGQDNGGTLDQGLNLNDGGQQNQSQSNDSGTVGNINPAWNDLLGVVPQQLHSQVTPHLQKWDQNFQTQIQKVHSQYEPWQPFVEQGVNPEDVSYGLNLVNAIANNPQEVLNALQEWVASENGQQGQLESTQQFQQQDPNTEFDITQHPQFQQLQGVVDSMAQIFLSQREQEQQAQEDQALDSDLAALREKYGDFDENYVLGVAASDPENFNEQSLEAAVQQFKQLEQNILSGRRQPGPPILGSGGNAPNTNVDTRQLSSADRKAMAIQMLQQAASQGQ